ncbi:hypothetical protein DFS33DRAFT_208087 [Desarmillaria ectypa]|nr:hypothetical protein DFS33DRAFT_208087 [Desarmillaria ectypa]
MSWPGDMGDPCGTYYTLLWPIAVILLGLTAYHIHFTKSHSAGYQPIIVELLVSSIFTALWEPLAVRSRDNNASKSQRHPKHLPFELLRLAILWMFCLVGDVYTTWCAFSGKECNVMTTRGSFQDYTYGGGSLDRLQIMPRAPSCIV